MRSKKRIFSQELVSRKILSFEDQVIVSISETKFKTNCTHSNDNFFSSLHSGLTE